MEKQEHLLTCLMEECAEVQKACAKALRFGLDNYNPEDGIPNKTTIAIELQEIIAIKEMLEETNIISQFKSGLALGIIAEKKKKVLKYMGKAEEWGTLEKENK